jgi:hypothetical protein
MDVDIAHTAASCEECVNQLPFLPAEPLQHHEPATQPFEFLHTDLSEVEGRHFLVIVDQFSGWPAFTMFADKNTTARRLINAFRALFMDTGGGGSVKTTSMLTITLCNSSEGGSVGKNWFAQASKMVPGSELRAPLMERLCGSEMDFDLQVKEL